MEESELIRKRKEKIDALKQENIDLYPNDARITDHTQAIHDRFGHLETADLENCPEGVRIAGRLMAIRNFGKASFVSIQDRKGKIQGYIGKQIVGDAAYALFKKLDVGDIIYLAGRIFRTKTGELTIEAAEIRLLSKAVQPLPEKWHGLTDVETRYRQRHLDLITNPDVREVFRKRSVIISLMRKFMEARDFLEVETPMMQPKAGGAAARPFKTHHNALGIDLYLRIAPELYLKRLITGGLERVFEINRNFRNEGISAFHNPEFTMMEFYQAYATYEDLMKMTEEMFVYITDHLFGSRRFPYQGREIDLTPPWQCITVKDAVIRYGSVSPDILEDGKKAFDYAKGIGLVADEADPLGKTMMLLFDALVEKKLIQPTFVTQYPVEVSPLARKNPTDPAFTDRFELYIAGREIANAFSELNDPLDQRERFLMQLKDREAGDEEAHEMDEDYISVLEYAMPPTAGEGIGIDRLVMLLTDSSSIRDVILFPQMRSRDETH